MALAVQTRARERQHTEDALAASERKFAVAFHASPDAVSLTSFPEGELVDFNDGFVRLTGFTRSEGLGRDTRELDLWAIPEEREQILGALARGEKVQGEEMSLRTRSGALKRCEVAAQVVDLLGRQTLISVVRDVSERHRAEEALRLSEARFATAFRASPDAILITSLPGGRILEVNDGFCQITAYDHDHVVGRTTTELELWHDLGERDRMFDHLQVDGRIRDFELQVRRATGEVRHCVLSAEVIEVADDPCLLSVVRDVTEREKVFHELESKNAELERFTYTVSHDLKSPLVTIEGFLGLLEQDAAKGDRERMTKDIARIRGATATMGRLLDELLELSRVGRLVNPPEPVPVGQLVSQVGDLLAGPLAEHRVKLVIDPDLPTILADRPRMGEVFQNLIENAIKFSAGQESPRIEVGRREGEEGEPVVFVRDNGIGIEPAYHEVVFGLFERLDPSVGGTGIGLALVRRIVEVHGGRVWVESEGLGQGTTFCLSLGEVASGVDGPGA